MAFDLHTIEALDGGTLARQDRLVLAMLNQVANAAGGGAGAAVTVTVSGLKTLPAAYNVLVNPGQDATWFVDTKTNDGFVVHLLPRLAANTLASGHIDIVVLG